LVGFAWIFSNSLGFSIIFGWGLEQLRVEGFQLRAGCAAGATNMARIGLELGSFSFFEKVEIGEIVNV
jgi:hypothetical protein